MANSASSNELHSITKHNNIVISGVGSNEVLKFDGSNWINQTLGEAGIAPVATPTFTTSITIGSASMTEADLERVEDITPGTAAASKAVVLDGSTNITGIGTISSGAITATTSITLNARGELRFADADSSNYIALESPATVGTSYTMTLPADLPAADEVLTVTSYSSGAGVLEWAEAGGGAITAINTEAANRVATFGSTTTELDGEANLTFDGTNLTVGTGNVVIGTAGKGIDFSITTDTTATGAARTSEVLDDYEEGTFTPFLSDNSGTDEGTAASGWVSGRYTKIGQRVFYQLVYKNSSISGLTNSDSSNIEGLPFTSYATHPGGISAAVVRGTYMNLVATEALVGVMNEGSTYIALYRYGGTEGAIALRIDKFSSGGYVVISGNYEAA